MYSIESEVRTISISGPDHAKTFEVVAGIALKDRGLIYGKHRVAHQKQHAERLALLSALHALVGLPEPEETPLTSGVQLEKVLLPEAPPNKNPISQLSELVQKESRLSNLAFDVLRIGGTDHAPIFQVTASVVVDRRNSKNFAATDSNSKKAKESAASGLLTILHDDFRPATPHAIDLSESPLEEDSPQWKNLLNELCQKNKISPPKFTHEKHGKDHAPIFKCKGLLITKDVAVESDFTNGATRKEAEYRACYQLYQKLAKEIAT
jgi:dsRNA-specific ribonuclease